jgi:hypothetical protein
MESRDRASTPEARGLAPLGSYIGVHGYHDLVVRAYNGQRRAMKFLYGKGLTDRARQLCAQRTDLKIAIAYWGADALQLLQLNPRKSNPKILCCLKGGKSDPNVIRKFHGQVRQNVTLPPSFIQRRLEPGHQ